MASIEPRLSVLGFVSQLWSKIGILSCSFGEKLDFSPKLQDKIWNGKPRFDAS